MFLWQGHAIFMLVTIKTASACLASNTPDRRCGEKSNCDAAGSMCGAHSMCSGTGSRCGPFSFCTGSNTACGPYSECTGSAKCEESPSPDIVRAPDVPDMADAGVYPRPWQHPDPGEYPGPGPRPRPRPYQAADTLTSWPALRASDQELVPPPEESRQERAGPFIRVNGYSSSPELPRPEKSETASREGGDGAFYLRIFVIFMVIVGLVALLFAAKLWRQGFAGTLGNRRAFLADGSADELWQGHAEEEVEERASDVMPQDELRAEAAKQVEVILSARSATAVLGDGPLEERRSEFRRLAKLLHPDKALVTGERANLALRRLLEAHRSLNSAVE